jgi:hypothetical protein
MELTPIVAVLTIALFVGGMALWIYAVLHPLLNHGHLGIAALSLFLFPLVPILYVLLHRCPDTARRAEAA